MLVDKDGTLWFGSLANGLVKFDPPAGAEFIRYRNDPRPRIVSGEDNVATLFQDREGNIWRACHMMAPNRFATSAAL